VEAIVGGESDDSRPPRQQADAPCVSPGMGLGPSRRRAYKPSLPDALADNDHPVCPTRQGVLTLISVPLYVRSGSVSVRVFGIDSRRPDRSSRFFRVVRAGVAQLVEHLICNQRVGGSNPFASSTTGKPEPGT
jgi:hypothetical protein